MRESMTGWSGGAASAEGTLQSETRAEPLAGGPRQTDVSAFELGRVKRVWRCGTASQRLSSWPSR